MRSPRLICLLSLIITALTCLAAPARAEDTIDLRLTHTGATVDLDWTGGAPVFEVYRSPDPRTILDPGNRLLETTDYKATDTPPAGEIFYYFVRGRSDCFRPLADSYVSAESPMGNFGGKLELLVDQGKFEKRSYLRFSLAGIPSGSVIDSATLILQQIDAPEDATVEVHESKGAWTETGVTWDSQPGPGPLADSRSQPPGAGKRSWDVTSLVADWASGVRVNDGMVLVTPNPVAVRYFSRENGETEVPRLCVDWHDPAEDALTRLDEASQKAVTVRFEGGAAATTDVQVPASSADPVDAALGYLGDYRDLFRLADPKQDLLLDRLRTWDGVTAVSFRRREGGIPVLDETLLVRTDGTWTLGSSSALRGGRRFTGTVQLNAAQARSAAIDSLAATHSGVRTTGEPSLYWVPVDIGGDTLRPAWRVQTSGKGLGSGLYVFNVVFIDAEDGSALLTADVSSTADRPGEDFNTKNGENDGSDTCYLFPWEWKETWYDDNGARPGYPGPPADFASDAPETTNATHGIYHYYYDNFSWQGLSGRGGETNSFVHWNPPGFNNARFTPFCNILTFGDGWGTSDVVGHEFTHGVIFFSVPLWFTHQPGAINEHLADFFGSQTDDNWLMAEDRRDGGVDRDGDGTIDVAGPIRDMSNPPAFGDPDHMDDYRDLDIFDDGAGVHTNSGIPNKAAFLLTAGGTHHGITTSGIGRTKAGTLFFSVMVSHLHPWSGFSHLRDEMVREAQRLQSSGSSGFTIGDVCDVINAYAAVGIGNPDTDCDGVPNDPSSDGDGDRIPDAVDNCPLDPNVRQADFDGDGFGNVCDPDLDGDGVPNDGDNCRTVSNAGQVDSDGDGIGDQCDDGDFDGVLDIHDNCPGVPNGSQADRDGDHLGDACDDDIDGDGYENPYDNCLLVENVSQANSDGDLYGDACDNCRLVVNDGQEDLDGDGSGDACDPDRDNDGILEDGDGSGIAGDNPCGGGERGNCDDNCPDDANPQQIDNDFDSIGLICDSDERAFFDGLSGAQELGLFLRHFDISSAMRVPVFPCSLANCPDRLSEGFNTTVTLTALTMDYAVRIVDDRGFVIADGGVAQAGDATMNFSVDHEYFYRDSPGGESYQGRQYFLEFFAPPGSKNGQVLEGKVNVDSSFD